MPKYGLTLLSDIQSALKTSLTANFDNLAELNDKKSAKSDETSSQIVGVNQVNSPVNPLESSNSNTSNGVSQDSKIDGYSSSSSSSSSIYIKPSTTVSEISEIIKSQKYEIDDLAWNASFSDKQKNYIFKNIVHNKLTREQAQSVVDVFAHKFSNNEPIQHLPAFLNTLVRSAKDGLLMSMDDVATGGDNDPEKKP